MATSPRRWWLAGLLGLAVPGLGQLYNGHPVRGLLFYAGIQLAGLAIVPLMQVPSFPLAVACPVLAGLGVIAAVVEAAFDARRNGAEFVPRSYNKPIAYVGIILAATVWSSLLTGWIREHQIQAFRIPSESMQQTLLVGDHFVVDRRPGARRPGPGSIVAFRFPGDRRRIHVSRVVAVEGQEVGLQSRKLVLDGKLQDEPFVQHVDPTEHPRESDPRDNFGPFAVPPGHVFVMGDNRDTSNDSRFWGPLPYEDVLGTVRVVYWSVDPATGTPRWDRIGRIPR